MSEHDRYLELSAASIDFELSPSDAADLTTHLAVCDGCRRIAGALHADARALRRLSEGVPAERVRERVLSGASGRRSSPLLVLAAAAVLVLAVVGGLSAGAVIRTTREIAPVEPTWTRLATPEGFPAGDGRSSVLAIAAVPSVGGVGLAAVGTGSAGGRVWLSADGLSWSLVADTPALARARPTAIAAMGGRFVVVGSMIDQAGEPSAAAWTSGDARTWTRADLPGSTGLLAVAASPAQVVVAGAGRSGSGLPIWSSTDGRSWVVASQTTRYTAASVTGITVGGPGFVAVGYDDRGAVAWTSTDAVAWTRVDEASFTMSRMTAVASTPAGLVAVGFDAHGPVAWTSLDGVSWVRADGFGASDARATAVAATSFGVVAVGHAPGGARAWMSVDGRDWRALTIGSVAGSGELTSIVAHGSLVVAGGATDGAAGMWLGRVAPANP